MRWAEQGVDPRLDSECQVPSHVSESAEGEDADATHSPSVAVRHMPVPAQSAGTAEPGEPDAGKQEARVEGAVPRSEEALKFRDVVMGLAVTEQATDQPQPDYYRDRVLGERSPAFAGCVAG